MSCPHHLVWDLWHPPGEEQIPPLKHDAETEYLATSAVARRLGVSRSTVLRAVRRGDIRPALHTPGGALRFLLSDVESYARGLFSRSSVAPAPAHGAVPTYAAIELDRLHRMLDHLPAAIAYWDADLRDVFANH
jgi:excisionase family DNA binding protein